MDIKYLTLHNGVAMSLVGFGTFLLSGEPRKNAVATAVKSGYHRIDTAEAYGTWPPGSGRAALTARRCFLLPR